MTTLAPALPMLPAAARERWQPIRGGLVNLYRYDYEEFRYEQGRLLLRGNNGTGKSRVLALQLPFLLDGDISPHRLEPDGDPAKRIEWNLLLGRYPDRLGYTWLEFGRRDPDGSEHYVTLGCGLHAVAGRGLAGKWLFVTDQRVGRDLFLVRPNGAPLTKDRLAEAVGDHRVFTSATAYRAAVDRALFRLGPQRYDALVTLLIQLRQPQLSRQLDEHRLSAALSEALAPLDPAVVADVAEAMRTLEADREALDGLAAAQAGVAAFLTEYSRYVRIVVSRRADAVHTQQRAYKSTMRRLRAAKTAQDEATVALTSATARLDELGEAEVAAEQAVRTLSASDRMRDAHALASARKQAEATARQAEDADRELSLATQARERRDRDATAAGERAAASWAAVAKAAALAGQRADAAGLAKDHERAFAPLALPDGPSDASPLRRARETAEQAAADRRMAVEHLARLERAAEAALGELRVAKQAQQQASGLLDEALEDQQAAHARLDEAEAVLARGYRSWTAQITELKPADPDGVAWELEHWARTGQGDSPVAEAARQALADAIERLGRARHDAEASLTDAETRLAGLREEETRLRAGVHTPPPAPHTRDPARRTTEPGAPLWALCDVAPEVDDAARAGLEAALEASGLLDAWVTPDRRLLAAGEHDAILVAGTSEQPKASLADVLVAAVDRSRPQAAAVSDATVTAVLRHIGLGEGAGPVWVADDGRWQAGPLHGSWTKPAAEHLGQGAREAARRRRLAELAGEIDAAEKVCAELTAAIEAIDQRRARAAEEAAAAPSDDPVRRALADIDAATRQVAVARERLATAETRTAERRQALEEAARARDEAAADLGLRDWLGRLDALREALAGYVAAVEGLLPRLEAHLQARRGAEEAAARAEEAAQAQVRHTTAAAEARRRAVAAASERDTLEATVGAQVEEILAELEAATRHLDGVRASLEESREAHNQARTARAVAEHQVAILEEALEADAARRQQAVDAFATFAGTGLLHEAHAELPAADDQAWSTDRAVRAAGRVAELLADIDSGDEAWRRVQGGIHRHLSVLIEALLPHDYEPSATLVDDVLVVAVPFRGRDCSMTQLRDALADEVAHRQSILDAREREVLENHLIGEVSAHLHDLLRAGEEWVREVNAELEANPTSTGMKLRFAWRPRPDGPAGLAEARTRLLRAGGTWSLAEREALGAFLQEQIRTVRAAQMTGTWQEHLAGALDYRAWHTFDVERWQDGAWKRLTRRTHGTGSGGEKAIALTIPQFAAAAAHFRSAGPQAPRLILLDEAFVGVDADMRSKCMGLLASFDLDFVMTSEREWGCYPTVPGLAIYQLATRPGVDAVGVTRWVWNGRQRVQANDPLPPASPPHNEPTDGAGVLV